MRFLNKDLSSYVRLQIIALNHRELLLRQQKRLKGHNNKDSLEVQVIFQEETLNCCGFWKGFALFKKSEMTHHCPSRFSVLGFEYCILLVEITLNFCNQKKQTCVCVCVFVYFFEHYQNAQPKTHTNLEVPQNKTPWVNKQHFLPNRSWKNTYPFRTIKIKNNPWLNPPEM